MLGLNSVFFVYYLLAYPLRHWHIRISYGRVGNHILMMPAQHQIHHSVALEPIDKNLAGMFAFWDWMFGTL
jgi:sterol desaturase/sphingolipid hydroxylase (fatty acid hydroxylase superfamily)